MEEVQSIVLELIEIENRKGLPLVASFAHSAAQETE